MSLSNTEPVIYGWKVINQSDILSQHDHLHCSFSVFVLSFHRFTNKNAGVTVAKHETCDHWFIIFLYDWLVVI